MLQKDVKYAKIGMSKAKMAGWIDFGKNAAGESIVKLKITVSVCLSVCLPI